MSCFDMRPFWPFFRSVFGFLARPTLRGTSNYKVTFWLEESCFRPLVEIIIGIKFPDENEVIQSNQVAVCFNNVRSAENNQMLTPNKFEEVFIVN